MRYLLWTLACLYTTSSAFAGDCDALRDRYSDSLDAVTVASGLVEAQLETMGKRAGTSLTDSKITVNVLETRNGPVSGFTRLSFGPITATFADGRSVRICSAAEEGRCATETEARFGWDLTRTDTFDSLGNPQGYECRLRSFPTPFPIFLNADTGRRVFDLAAPRGLWVTETH